MSPSSVRVLCAGALALVLPGCSPELEALAPLVGRWSCAQKPFEGCEMAFGADGFVRLWARGQSSELHAIRSVVQHSEGTRTELRVVYETEDSTDLLRVELIDANTLRLANQRDVTWERKE